ncbi:MAG: FCD domain-containing protein [Acidimicrobiales bacterium]
MRKRKGRSLTEDVYEQLRADVLHGKLGAGERLLLDVLARDYGVSLGVVREAVTRLASERLVDAVPQAGFRVRLASPEHLADLTWARCHVERVTVSSSVEHGDTGWEGELVAAHHVLAVTDMLGPDGSANPDWMDAHRRFHTVLASACPNATMQVVRQQLFDEAELYRHLSGRRGIELPTVAVEHRDLLDAALEHDAERAADLIQAHLESTAQRIEFSSPVANDADG